MGPSWYWMPDVFERFFNDFGFSSSQFYSLDLLHPAFDMVFGQDDIVSIPQDFEELCELV
jgi:phytoene desaturase